MIRVGVVGASGWADNSHLPALAAIEEFEVTAGRDHQPSQRGPGGGRSRRTARLRRRVRTHRAP